MMTKRTDIRIFRALIISSLFFGLLISFNLLSSSMALENYLIQVKSSSSGYFEGYNLFVLEKRDVSNYTPIEKKLLITNMEGDIVKKLDLGKQGALADFSAEFINSTTILFGNQSGANLWNIYTNQTQSLGYWGHHEYEFNPYNNTFFTFNAFIMEHNDEKYLIDTIDRSSFVHFLVSLSS